MPPTTGPIRLELTPELEAALREVREELVPVLEDAAALADASAQLLEFVPANVSPVVLVRERLDALEQALERFRDHAAVILADPDPEGADHAERDEEPGA